MAHEGLFACGDGLAPAIKAVVSWIELFVAILALAARCRVARPGPAVTVVRGSMILGGCLGHGGCTAHALGLNTDVLSFARLLSRRHVARDTSCRSNGNEKRILEVVTL